MGIGVIGSLSNTAEVLPDGAVEKVATIRCNGVAALPTLTAGNYIVKSTGPVSIFGSAFGKTEQLDFVNEKDGFFSISSTRSDLEVELAKPFFEDKPMPANFAVQKPHIASASANPNKIFVMGNYSNSGALSLDGGQTWSTVNFPYGEYVACFVDSSGRLFLAPGQQDNNATSGRPLVSTDNGATWTQFTTTTPSGMSRRLAFGVNGGQWIQLWTNTTAAVTELTVSYGDTSSSSQVGQFQWTSLSSLAYGSNSNYWTAVRAVPSSTWFMLVTYNNTSGSYRINFVNSAAYPGSLTGGSNRMNSRDNSDAAYAFPVRPDNLPFIRFMARSGNAYTTSFVGLGIASSPTSVSSVTGTSLRSELFSTGADEITDQVGEIVGIRNSIVYAAQRDSNASGNFTRRVLAISSPYKATSSQSVRDYISAEDITGFFSSVYKQALSDYRNASFITPSGKWIAFVSSDRYYEARPEYITIYKAI